MYSRICHPNTNRICTETNFVPHLPPPLVGVHNNAGQCSILHELCEFVTLMLKVTTLKISTRFYVYHQDLSSYRAARLTALWPSHRKNLNIKLQHFANTIADSNATATPFTISTVNTNVGVEQKLFLCIPVKASYYR